MKLILKYCITDNYTYSCDIDIPFEYESKEKFVFDLLEKFNQQYWDEQAMLEEYKTCEIFDYKFYKFDFDQLEHYVYTLEEWFEKYKIKSL